MKIVAISDIHGFLPKIPKCDVLVIAGDICEYNQESIKYQRKWLRFTFLPWLKQVPAKQKLFIPGNHDWFMERIYLHRLLGMQVSNNPAEEGGIDLTYQSVHYENEVFSGIPFIPNLHHYAFYLPNDELYRKVEQIPKDTTILVTHSPPFQCGDSFDGGHVGNIPLKDAIINGWFPNLKLVISGHVHESYGKHWITSKIPVYNCAIMNREPRPVNQPHIIDV